MGFDKRDKDENLKPVLLVATIVLAACMLVCSYFIFDMAKKIRRDAERNFQEHVSVAGQVITSSMEGVQKSVTSAADAITVQFRSATDDEKIRSILKEYQNVSGIAVVTYVETNGMTHFADKPKEVATLGGELKLVMKSEPYSEVSTKYQLDGTTGVVLATAPVYKSDRQVGSVVAIKSLAGTLEDKSFDYLKSSGQLFLIDKSGSIYEQAGQQLGLKSVETNIFRRLQTMTGKNNARNRDALQSLKEHVNEED